jgi:aminoglycoside phosphotransferase (APT) family kinase protein
MIFTNNLLRSQSDGTTDMTTSHLTHPAKDAGLVIGYSHSTDETSSHSTWLSKNDNQVAGYAASRARSLLCAAVVASATGTARPTPCGCAYPFDMPRRSPRGSLHLGLLAMVLWGNR